MRQHRNILFPLILKYYFLLLWLILIPAFAAGDEEVVTLSVTDFTTHASEDLSFLGKSFSESMTTKLSKIGQIHIYERSQFERIAGELKLAQDRSELFNQDTVQHIGKIVAVDYMLIGSVTKLGDLISVEIRLVNVNSGRTVLARELKGDYPEEVFDLQDRAALDVSEALQIRLSGLDREMITDDPTKDLNAYQLYNSALADEERRIDLLESALKRDPDFRQARHLLAESYFAIGALAKADAEYSRLLEASPEDYKALYNSALIAFDGGGMKKAEELLSACTDLRPKDADVWYHRGLLREFSPAGERLGEGCDLAAAVDFYGRALELNPHHYEALYARGVLSAKLGQNESDPQRQLEYLETALGSLKSFLEIYPNAVNAEEVELNLEMLSSVIVQLKDYIDQQ